MVSFIPTNLMSQRPGAPRVFRVKDQKAVCEWPKAGEARKETCKVTGWRGKARSLNNFSVAGLCPSVSDSTAAFSVSRV